MLRELITRSAPTDPNYAARIYCVAERPFRPIDLANLFEPEIVRPGLVPVTAPDRVFDEAPPVGTIWVNHWDAADWIEAEADRPDRGEARVLVYHAGVDPVTRTCQNCGSTCGRRP